MSEVSAAAWTTTSGMWLTDSRAHIAWCVGTLSPIWSEVTSCVGYVLRSISAITRVAGWWRVFLLCLQEAVWRGFVSQQAWHKWQS